MSDVLEVYRITLLSNMQWGFQINNASFRGLQNYTTLKPAVSNRMITAAF